MLELESSESLSTGVPNPEEVSLSGDSKWWRGLARTALPGDGLFGVGVGVRPLCHGCGDPASFGLPPKVAGADLPLMPGLSLTSVSGICVPAGTAT